MMRFWIFLLLGMTCALAQVAPSDPNLAIFISVENQKDGDGMFCDVAVGDWDYHIHHPLVIDPKDVLEYDLLLSPNIPAVDGGLYLTFQGGAHIKFPSQEDPSTKSTMSQIEKARGQWQHITMPIGAAAGHEVESWIYHIAGKKAGPYQLALDNLRITNQGKVRCQFYQNEPIVCFNLLAYNGFHFPFVIPFPEKLTHQAERTGEMFSKLYQAGVARWLLSATYQGLSFLEEEYKTSKSPSSFPQLAEKAMPFLDETLLDQFKTKEFDANFQKAMALLSPLQPSAKQYTLHAVSYAHLDFIWMWSWAETLRCAKKDFAQVLAFMDEFPDFHFSYTSPALFEALEKEDPELFAKIQQRVRDGRWEMIGSRWCEADANQISEESHARHFLFSNRYNREKFGVETRVDFEPDIFGHIATFPQMLKKSGISYYVSRRMKGPMAFWWEGPDGSRVLALNIHHYMDNLRFDPLDYSFTKDQRAYGFKDALVVYGVGNHGGGPSRDEIQNAGALDKIPVYPKVQFSTLHQFMDRIAATRTLKALPIVKNDLGHPLNGTYSLHADIKSLNRECERLLVTDESFAAISQLLGIGPNAHRFESAWKTVLWAHHHDTISGTTIRESADYAKQILTSVRDSVRGDLLQTLKDLADHISTTARSGQPRVVFNSLAWKSTHPVTFTLPDPSKSWNWVDSSGHAFPVQPDLASGKSSEGVAVLPDLPGLGYRTGWLESGSEKSASPLKRTGPFSAENQFLRIEVSPKTGNLISIRHLKSGREWIALKSEAARCRIDLEPPHPMSAWLIGDIEKSTLLDHAEKVECLEEGPVRIVFRASYRYNQSTIQKDIVFYRDLSRIDFTMNIDWKETGSLKKDAPMLRLEFPLAQADSEAIYLIPFGEVARPKNDTDYAASYGMGLAGASGSACLLNDYKGGYSAADNVLRVTIVRSPYSPDPGPDLGKQTSRFALQISEKKWSDTGMSRRGMEFDRAPIAIETGAHDGILPAERSFLSVEKESAVITAFKMAEDAPDDVILRMFDANGAPLETQASTSLPLKQWTETDFIERPLSPAVTASSQKLSLKPWEIKTFRLISEKK